MTTNAKPKTPEEYRDVLICIAGQAKLLASFPVPEMLEMIERADAFGGMIDPTLYREKHAGMMQDKELLEAALPFYRLGEKLEALTAVARQNRLAAGGGA